MGYDIPSDHHSAGYDEYDRKPRKDNLLPVMPVGTWPGGKWIAQRDARMFTDGEPSTVQMGVDSKVSVGVTLVTEAGGSTKLASELERQGWALEIGEHTEADKAARRSPAITLWVQQHKPRVRVDTMVGAHSKTEYTRVLFVHAQHTFVQWKTNARDAWADFARRLRLGQP